MTIPSAKHKAKKKNVRNLERQLWSRIKLLEEKINSSADGWSYFKLYIIIMFYLFESDWMFCTFTISLI